MNLSGEDEHVQLPDKLSAEIPKTIYISNNMIENLVKRLKKEENKDNNNQGKYVQHCSYVSQLTQYYHIIQEAIDMPKKEEHQHHLIELQQKI